MLPSVFFLFFVATATKSLEQVPMQASAHDASPPLAGDRATPGFRAAEGADRLQSTPATRQKVSPPLLSVIIKTLNEEAKIGPCLASVQAATQGCRAEIIVADSRSDDNTVAVAESFGVDVVRLAPSEPRGCGIGAQLGFQHSSGDYILLMDGDMRLSPGFLPEALALLEQDPGLAGVGGVMILDEANLEYRLRLERNMPHLRPGLVDRLDGGGLYRRSAIESVGYLTNLNLHSYEELELALRLRQAGWRLRRIATVAVAHRGHTVPALRLLRSRWRSRYTDGQGEAVRAAFATSRVVPLLREFWLSAAVVGWWCCLALLTSFALVSGTPLWPTFALAVLPLIVMTAKRRSVIKAGYSVILWQVIAAGFLRGLLRRQRDPKSLIESEVVHVSPGASAGAARKAPDVAGRQSNGIPVEARSR